MDKKQLGHSCFNFLIFKRMSKKAQITEAIVDIAALFFLILLFVVAFMLVGNHKDKVTRDFIEQDIKGLSLEYASLNLMRQNSVHGQISDEIRLFCNGQQKTDDFKLVLENIVTKIEKEQDKLTFELKDDTCGRNFKETFVNLPNTKKQTNCVNSYNTQIVIVNIKQNPIVLDVSSQICAVKKK